MVKGEHEVNSSAVSKKMVYTSTANHRSSTNLIECHVMMRNVRQGAIYT